MEVESECTHSLRAFFVSISKLFMSTPSSAKWMNILYWWGAFRVVRPNARNLNKNYFRNFREIFVFSESWKHNQIRWPHMNFSSAQFELNFHFMASKSHLSSHRRRDIKWYPNRCGGRHRRRYAKIVSKSLDVRRLFSQCSHVLILFFFSLHFLCVGLCVCVYVTRAYTYVKMNKPRRRVWRVIRSFVNTWRPFRLLSSRFASRNYIIGHRNVRTEWTMKTNRKSNRRRIEILLLCLWCIW